MAPPRVLTVPYVLGRPLGEPNNPELQHEVLTAALNLLPRTDGPLMVDFEDDSARSDSAEDAWVCPVVFDQSESDTPLGHQVKAEIRLLQPWHAKHLQTKGTTTMTHAGSMDELVDTLTSYLEPDQSGSAAQLKSAAEDLKAFYNEAATSQPGTATAKGLEDWYWQETRAGDLIRSIKQHYEQAEDPKLKITAGFLLVPGAQSGGDH